MTLTPPTTPAADAWLAVATLLRPQGRRGELLAEPLSDLPDIFSAGRNVMLGGKVGAAAKVGTAAQHGTAAKNLEPRTVEDHWSPTGRNAGRIVLKLSGCDTIDDAEALAGRQVLIAAAELPTLDEDTFFVGDLVGCSFFAGEELAGTIVAVEFPVGSDGRTRLEDAAPLLAVELPGEAEPVLVPFVRAWLERVDITARRVVMHLPEGLLRGEGEPVGEEHGDQDDEDSDAV